MSQAGRRHFLKLAGALAGAPLLVPIARSLIGEAFGAPSERRIALVFAVGETMPLSPPYGLVPATIPVAGKERDRIAIDTTDFEWPSMLQPLEPFKQRMLLIDSLYNHVGKVQEKIFAGVQHGTGFGCLTGRTPLDESAEYGGAPAGISLDQHIAQVSGRDTPVASINIGFQGKNPQELSATTFATGPRAPLAHVGSPALLHQRLFSKAGGEATMPDPNVGLMQTALLDSMRDDIKRLQGQLAAPERVRLDSYLAAVDDYDRRQQELARLGGSCAAAPVPEEAQGGGARLKTMLDMSALAVTCGLTNVVGVSVGLGFSHDDLAVMNDILPRPYSGHSAEEYNPTVNVLYQYLSGLVADFLIKIGPLADKSVMLLTAGQGLNDDTHHAEVKRWPAIVYDGTGTLRTGGRFLRYPARVRSVVDVYSAVAHAAGAPIDDFATGSFNTVQGPPPEVMA